jgi:hypothetical protein
MAILYDCNVFKMFMPVFLSIVFLAFYDAHHNSLNATGHCTCV